MLGGRVGRGWYFARASVCGGDGGKSRNNDGMGWTGVVLMRGQVYVVVMGKSRNNDGMERT